MIENHITLQFSKCRGRALFAKPDGTLYRSLHYDVFRSTDDGRSWCRTLSIFRSPKRRVVEPFRLLCRLLRHEVRGLIPLPCGGHVAATRSGVFWASSGETVMQPAALEEGDSPVKWPMTISADAYGRILWGEYWGNPDNREVRIFVSEDQGRSYHIAHTFPACETRHVHNIMFDKTLDRFWVFCGDHEHDPGIGLMDADFSNFEWVLRGQQRCRAVCAFDLGDHLVYATDTEIEPNGIYVLDKSTGHTRRISKTDGSCIYATKCGAYYVISTTAEPLKGAPKRNGKAAASIWLSKDAYSWRQVFSGVKDTWSYKYFQFGSLVLPRGYSRHPLLMVSGQAIRQMDGRLFTVDLESCAGF